MPSLHAARRQTNDPPRRRIDAQRRPAECLVRGVRHQIGWLDAGRARALTRTRRAAGGHARLGNRAAPTRGGNDPPWSVWTACASSRPFWVARFATGIETTGVNVAQDLKAASQPSPAQPSPAHRTGWRKASPSPACFDSRAGGRPLLDHRPAPGRTRVGEARAMAFKLGSGLRARRHAGPRRLVTHDHQAHGADERRVLDPVGANGVIRQACAAAATRRPRSQPCD
ncbi:hypothetical protein SAMN07250955_108135 [Arboricoccus pini]|uniref:Uncharacterized protein n=1 Tax=Arboricoccus pini TaxID=1963835 RepID=A0A212RGL9_9PROT|nr:hypothetical protein SAMN07250955_108135 [Arboricoccus pini]